MAGDLEIAAQPLRALAHAQDSEMSARGGKNVARLKSAAVVLDLQKQLTPFDVQADYDAGGAGVLHDVGHGLLSNAQQVLLDLLGQAGGWARRVHFDFDSRAGRPHARAGFECSREILALERGGAQVHYGAAGFGEAMTRHAAREIEEAPCGRDLFGHAHGDRVELRGDADESLGKSVMDLAGEPRALFEYKTEAVADLPQAELVHGPRRSYEHGGDEQAEPHALVESRQDFEGEHALGGGSARNFGADRKLIAARRERVVDDGAARTDGNPGTVYAREPVGVADLLGSAQVDGSIADLNALAPRPKLLGAEQIDWLSIDREFDQMDLRRELGGRTERRVVDGEAAAGSEPHATVRGAGAAAADRVTRCALRAA